MVFIKKGLVAGPRKKCKSWLMLSRCDTMLERLPQRGLMFGGGGTTKERAEVRYTPGNAFLASHDDCAKIDF